MSHVIMVEIVKIDKETGKSYSYKVPYPRIMTLTDEQVSQKFSSTFYKGLGCNVGDFLIVENKVYRKIRGDMIPATDDELAELLAAKLGEALEENAEQKTEADGRSNGNDLPSRRRNCVDVQRRT